MLFFVYTSKIWFSIPLVYESINWCMVALPQELRVEEGHARTCVLAKFGIQRCPKIYDNVIEHLGKGHFGSVALVELPSRRFAVKKIGKAQLAKDKSALLLLKNEIEAGMACDNPFVVKMYDYYEDKDNVCLVFELLIESLKSRFGQILHGIPEDFARYYVAQAFLALNHLHFKGYTHNDVWIENFLLDNQGFLKLIDFGFAFKLEDFKDPIKRKEYIGIENSMPFRGKRLTPYFVSIFGIPVENSMSLIKLLEPEKGQPANGIAEDYVRFYIAQAFLALNHLHSKGYTHNDAWIENFLLDKQGFVKLIDFGLAFKLEDFKDPSKNPKDPKNKEKGIENSMPFRGWYYNRAPERIELKEYGPSSDFWALGLLTYRLAFAVEAFNAIPAKEKETEEEKIARWQKEETMILQGKYEMPESPKVSENLKDFISSLLIVDPKKRLGHADPEDIKKHKWFTSVNFDWEALVRKDVSFRETFELQRYLNERP
ncbi:protein kinase domain-containing protein [Ditylenchus destructor]|uniref:Serine/threonine-protein kinase greatwall n=1 Tax=Ditylenchus destructor TaxID=166010 RepID=A0AAD4MT79_9BILA|nr:protein kinase domain-containing protein [Ditylenchus destructor]